MTFRVFFSRAILGTHEQLTSALEQQAAASEAATGASVAVLATGFEIC
jgi:hypothetical protein